MHAVLDAAGLPRDLQTLEVVQSLLTPCLQDTFSDGEIAISHPRGLTDSNPKLRRAFGRRNFRDGEIVARLRAIAAGDDPALRHHMAELIKASATVLAQDVAAGRMELPPPTITVNMPNRELIVGDEFRIPLAGEPNSGQLPRIVDYGPGLKGQHHIDTQVEALLTRGDPGYLYLAMTKGPFVNSFLQSYWAERLQTKLSVPRGQVDGTMGVFSQNGVYMGREDGMAAASTEIIEAQRRHGADPRVADVVLASGIHLAGHRELETAIGNAHVLLKPEGTLLIRAPKHALSPDDVTAEGMVELARRAGFDLTKAIRFETLSTSDIAAPVETLCVAVRK